MSGTSLDGVDAVLADLGAAQTGTEQNAHAPQAAALSPDSPPPGPAAPHVLGHVALPLPPQLRSELLALNTSGPDELHRAALAANALVRTYAEAVHMLLTQCDCTPAQVRAIGVHGQTVRHRPGEFDGTGYTLQLNQPALLAELTGIDVVADLRSRDVAAGGQGAPLAPLFHQAYFGRSSHAVAVLNVGGMSNLTLLAPTGAVQGWDCGPGNALLDAWCAQHTGQAFDAGGAWAASGRVLPPLLTALLAEPYFVRQPPKSTGRDLFNGAWLRAHLTRHPGARPADVQATLAELTARACAADVRTYGGATRELLVCGGGALNSDLMQRLAAQLPGVQVQSTQARGLHPLQVEALAFAWLAQQTVERQALTLQNVTGAKGARVLGCIYPR